MSCRDSRNSLKEKKEYLLEATLESKTTRGTCREIRTPSRDRWR